eukprot:3784898-Rhodomonas_salina.2
MWVWDILKRVRTRGQFTAIVGETSLETCPTFEKCCQWGGLNSNQLQPGDITLVLLDAIPPEWQVHALAEVAQTKEWAAVALSTLLHESAEEWLLHNARHQETEQNPARGSTGVAIRTAGPPTGLGQSMHRPTQVPQGHSKPRPDHR